MRTGYRARNRPAPIRRELSRSRRRDRRQPRSGGQSPLRPDLLAIARIKIEPVTEGQAKIARGAYRDFGKGSGHAARLNFGDCFAYALAKEMREPLLFKGEDFSHTDLTPAVEAKARHRP